ncbi:MAG: 3-isopropylmalate dehydratase small subunit [Chromatiales bacterium]|jgi:3-isopropylmalate/(R)-2-methylmalate dehydratase small subunit|nr:3-isopropylmalate dehydratase small subunit [Chromatiales bacterium]MDP6149949.1 3-isopropylmalate dehydratase small subunit [Gammaproteobacteria bacterium]MDP7092878.1 3-isopropylmalate dehydratase small subunit [Gammaproteobacteria bacterium]MDP7271501.1 3-isopropylmalate dehydratase small subunit [Gammaproteobacteria bacterium]HJP04476.1 3-isopropylmalate dehydratase small subunit [Gammaproteobacteria bacterium]
MEKFIELEAIAAPLMRINIDTDVIIPSREMKRVSKEGLSDGMFANWRYTEPGGREENPEFVLNQEPYRQAKILLAGDNFGCGSSREHAVWALAEWGIRCIIAPGFGNIFHGNCVRNGILPVILPEDTVSDLARQVEEDPAKNTIKVDLITCTVAAPDQTTNSFEIAPADREMLLEGLDAIAVTRRYDDEILAFQGRDRLKRPWIYL